MSILIKGMEMPEHCGYCRFRYDGICHALQKTQYSTEDCPLTPVPPHGRLIDADALLSQYEGNIWTAQTDYAEGLRDVANDLKQAPTIIEAEEVESDA